ncbi:MAG: gluconate 2-dehydrogenase subunit 3 family protein [Armatimonadetes bacterium]|nr:gluconate 2-dehydrogenase subunit 3 family protein [Armatimonadota bacterium]MDE2207159.1 gluconate 2-dehydrogenase subunit 3 family protein [Armatimonadota bacterium]
MLTPSELSTLRAFMDCLIPADDWPSAWRNGVGQYLMRQFAGPLRHMLPAYRSALAELDAESVARFSCPFADCGSERQLELLVAIAAGEACPETRNLLPAAASHAAEGYYADPGNGGNPEMTSWRMVGYLLPGEISAP